MRRDLVQPDEIRGSYARLSALSRSDLRLALAYVELPWVGSSLGQFTDADGRVLLPAWYRAVLVPA